MQPIIKRNSTIPANESAKFKTVEDNQSFITILVLEGEGTRSKDNFLVGQIEIKNLTPKPAGQVEIECTFRVDGDGILETTVVELGKDNPVGNMVSYIFQANFNLTVDMIQRFMEEMNPQ